MTEYPWRIFAARPASALLIYFNWKRKYDGLLPTEMRRLKQLEDENGKLRKVVADLNLDKEMLQDDLRRKL
jgi:putative transposase